LRRGRRGTRAGRAHAKTRAQRPPQHRPTSASTGQSRSQHRHGEASPSTTDAERRTPWPTRARSRPAHNNPNTRPAACQLVPPMGIPQYKCRTARQGSAPMARRTHNRQLRFPPDPGAHSVSGPAPRRDPSPAPAPTKPCPVFRCVRATCRISTSTTKTPYRPAAPPAVWGSSRGGPEDYVRGPLWRCVRPKRGASASFRGRGALARARVSRRVSPGRSVAACQPRRSAV